MGQIGHEGSMGNEIKRIKLPQACDTPFAGALHEEITRDLPGISEVLMDASAVERINTPAIQLLVMLSRALGAENIHLSVESCSPAFVAGFEQLGLGAQLTEWRAA
jgi:anti-anti-sigma regulatory factor